MLQDQFLKNMVQARVPVTIYLMNGIRLLGEVESFDQYGLVLGGTSQQFVYKHAISTIVPSREIALRSAAPGEPKDAAQAPRKEAAAAESKDAAQTPRKEAAAAEPKEAAQATPKQAAPADPKEASPADPKGAAPVDPKDADPKEAAPAGPKGVAPRKTTTLRARTKRL